MTPKNAAAGRARFVAVFVGLLIGLAAAAVLGMAIGAVTMSPAEVLSGLVDGDSLIWRYRAPRILVGVVAGASMAVAGALLQSALRNPLAAPDTVGITAGGGLAAVAALLGVGTVPASQLTAVALVGALIGAVVVFLLAGRGIADPVRLTLTGVAVSVVFSALTQLLLVRAAPEAGAAMTWLRGSLYARTVADAEIVAPFVALGVVAVLVVAHHLDMLGLDDSSMRGVGVSPLAWRVIAVGLAVTLGAAAVAAAGVLGFAGLIVPHAARMLVGSTMLRQVPVAAVGGAALVVVCDAIGRWAFAPTEIPVGALIAVVGAPYFIYLLLKMTKVKD